MHSEFLMIQKIRNGDEKACEWFVEKYYAAIYQYCFLHIRDRYYAEDMTQETFLKFFASLKNYTFCGKTKNYLYRIAGNLIRNHHKKKKEVLTDKFPENFSCIAAGMDGRKTWNGTETGQDVMQKKAEPGTDIELRMDIEHAVDFMPDEIREVAILFFFQELRQREIADLLDIKLSLVKYRVSRAKKILSEYLEVGNK